MSNQSLRAELRMTRLLAILLGAGAVAGLSEVLLGAAQGSLGAKSGLHAAWGVMAAVCSAGWITLRASRRARAEVRETAHLSEGFETVLRMANEELTIANSELNEMSSYHQAILESQPDAVLVVQEDCRVKLVNRSAERLFGVKRGSLLAREAGEIAGGTAVAEMLHETLRTGQTLQKAEQEVAGASGDRVSVSITTAPLLTAEGRQQGAVAVVRDLSLVKQMELAMLRSERLASLGTLAAGVAHELRNPLNAIRGFAERLSNKISPDAPYHGYAKIIMGEVDRLNVIVSQILDYGSARTPRQERLHLGGVVEEILLFVADKALKQRVKVVREIEPGVPELFGDRQQLKQVFLNLILNGVQAMEKGGTLTVNVRSPHMPSLLPHVAEGEQAGHALAAALSDRCVEVEVRDTGMGIPADVLPRLFTPFYTTKEQGTGLGLSITHKIIESHGGWIEVQSREGAGAAFTVRLPVRETPTHAGDATVPAALAHAA